MGFSCGIVGLPNAGKSTIFNAMTQAGSAVAAYPFCTIDPKEGIVAVPDSRLRQLSELIAPPATTPTTLTFVDIAGLVKGAHQGEGLGNRFLSHIREVDAVVHVVRYFESGKVSHVNEKLDPQGDFEVVMTELLLADLDTVQRRRSKCERMAKVGDKEARQQLDLLHRLEASLSRSIPAARIPLRDAKEERAFSELFLLTAKPAMLVANISEDQLVSEDDQVVSLQQHISDLSIPVLPICGKLEMELCELAESDRLEFMEDLGLERLGLESLIRQGYELLDLVTFYTTVGTELRAWTVKRGTPAPAAAGRIHTDMERGFIKGEVIPFDDLVRSGSEHAARRAGLARIEGKEYEIQDGDVVYFHFRE